MVKPSPPKWRHNVLLGGAVLVWLGGLVFGFALIVNYEWASAGISDERLRLSDLGIETLPRGPALVMFVHPRCPCTKASVAELQRLMCRLESKPPVYLAFLQPASVKDEWRKAGLWRTVVAINGFQAVVDHQGTLARRCGARTSGELLVFDQAGDLAFRGGITSSRGHAGDNHGADAVVDVLKGLGPRRRLNPVFGCSLFND